MLDPWVGRYYSNKQVRKEIFRQDEDDMELNDAEIAEEMSNPQYNPPEMMDPNMNPAALPPPMQQPPSKKNK
jgi:hypothetical protein